MFDSVYKEDENYYRKVFLEQCFVFVFWKIPTNKIKFINLYKKTGKLILSNLEILEMEKKPF